MAITTNGAQGTTLALSADLAAAVSDESGTGVIVFNTSPTLVTPTLGTASATAIELGHATDTTLARASAGVVTIEGVNVVTTSSTDTLTNKTLTSPITNTATINDAILKSPEERMNIVAAAATGTINFDTTTSTIWYYTTSASANHTLNFRFSSGVTLNTALATGDAITVVWLNTNGATPYYPNVIQVDGSTVTPKFQNGTAFSAGNASSIDAYSFTIIKTASATFTVLASQTKFA
jgi:hypothetical protein